MLFRSRALVRLTIFGQRQGGSTIEQQLIRTITRDYRISFRRKVREILLASTLYGRFSKADVLACYLAIAYFGTGLHGVRIAAHRIKIPAEFSQHHAPYLVAHLRYPRPAKVRDSCIERRLRRAHHIASKVARAREIGTERNS